jgi:tRNA-specific 2-thiouridylase
LRTSKISTPSPNLSRTGRIGVTLRLFDARGTAASLGGRCCGPRDIEDARATAAAMGFAHYVLDESEAFRRAVIDDFVAEYRTGRTPNPCVRCNEHLKFGPLLRFAHAIGADALATGHYARVDVRDARDVRLLRAVDREKDQSYFLFGVRTDLLAIVQFPLGGMTKAEVRAAARRLGLPNAGKPDSQELCFIPDGDHAQFLEARGGAGPAGQIVDEMGNPLAAHEGTHRFTVGQRRGIPGKDGQRRFVARIDAATGTVHTARHGAHGRRKIGVTDVRWFAPPRTGAPFRCDVQIRHRATAKPANAVEVSGSKSFVEVEFDAPVEGAAPGQAAVFFSGDEVIGGGWIAT